MVELKILVVILRHDHAAVVDWATNWLESIVADNRVQKSGHELMNMIVGNSNIVLYLQYVELEFCWRFCTKLD